MKLTVITTHPIQYIAPWFRSLSLRRDIQLHVMFLRELDSVSQGVGFGKAFSWDVALRDGYSSEVLDVDANSRHILRSILQLLRRLRANEPDVVVITGWNEPALAASIPMARIAGFRTLVRGESNDKRERSLAARVFHRTLLRFASAIVLIGKGNLRFYESYAYPSERMFSGAYFVETDRMLRMARDHSHERGALRGTEGANDGDVVFAFCGKHVPFKRPSWLVEAAGMLVREGLPVRLRFAGSGELTDSLVERCRALGVPAHFTGFLNQTEMWRAYVGADVFVLPSTNRETWGLVVNEAMLFGLPAIVCNEVGCVPDLVVENETGWSFQDSVESLTNVMRIAIRDRARLPHMGARASKHVADNYSMEVATDGLLQAVRYLVK